MIRKGKQMITIQYTINIRNTIYNKYKKYNLQYTINIKSTIYNIYNKSKKYNI